MGRGGERRGGEARGGEGRGGEGRGGERRGEEARGALHHFATHTFRFLRILSIKNIQQFSLVSCNPAPLTSFLTPDMMFSTSSSGKSPGISPDASRSLINTKKCSSGICASVSKNTVPMFLRPAFEHNIAKSV